MTGRKIAYKSEKKRYFDKDVIKIKSEKLQKIHAGSKKQRLVINTQLNLRLITNPECHID